MWLKYVAFLFSFLSLSLLTLAQTDPIYITGQVALAGGEPPPAAVRVELRCHGSVVQSVYTSPEGHFSFRMSERNPGVKSEPDARRMDAAIGGPYIPANVDRRTQGGKAAFHQVDLSRCQCEASLSGYRSEPVPLGVRSRFDNPEIGAIILHPIELEGTLVSVTTLKAPKDAVEAFQEAEKELSADKVEYEKAVKYLETATRLYPEFALAWCRLGEVHTAQQKVEAARAAFRQAIATDPGFIYPYDFLAQLELQNGQMEETVRLTAKALELNSNWISARYYQAIAQYYLGNLEGAEESLRIVQKSEDSAAYPSSHYLLGHIHAERGEHQDASVQYSLFLETNPPEDLGSEVRTTLAQWKETGLIN